MLSVSLFACSRAQQESREGILERYRILHSSSVSRWVQELRDIIRRFLVQNPNQRLGALKGGAADVKMHPWFANFDWTTFGKRQLKAPYVPQVRLHASEMTLPVVARRSVRMT